MTTTKGFITGAATTALDTRKADGAKLVANTDGSPRLGVIGNNPSIVTSDPSTAPMRVAVAGAGFATQRAAGDGAAVWTNDGAIFVTITKPGSQSWYVTLYAKHDDTTQGDADNLPVIGVVTGAASATPTEAAIPAGATKIATVLVPSTATSSQSAGVVITNVYQMTAYAGGVVPFRKYTDLTAWTTATDGQLAYALDTENLWEWIAAAVTPGWYHVGGKPVAGVVSYSGIYAAGSPNPRLLSGNGMNTLDGIVTSTTASFVAGTTYAIGSIPATMAPATTQVFSCVSNISAVVWLVISPTGAVTMVLSLSFTGALNLTLTNCLWRTKGLV